MERTFHIEGSLRVTQQDRRSWAQGGATIIPGDISIIYLDDANAAVRAEVLARMEAVEDPLLHLHFRSTPQLDPLVPLGVRLAAINVISAYQNLTAADLAVNERPPIPVVVPPQWHVWHFQQAQMALSFLFRRLSDPGDAPSTQHIHRMAPGSYICDIEVVFANAAVFMPVTRSV